MVLKKIMPVHTFTCGYANTYLIENKNSFAAVDVGTYSAAETIHEFFCERPIDATLLKVVTATHFHIDHIAGISRLTNLFPEVRVYFFVMVDNYLKRISRICLFSLSKWVRGLWPTLRKLDNHMKNITAALRSDRTAIPLPLIRRHIPTYFKAECILDEHMPFPNLGDWQLVKTPGHTTDSVCFYSGDEGSFISGDTIINMNGSGELNKFCCNNDDIKRSFRKISTLNIKHIYPGHGAPLHGIDGLNNIVQE